MRRFLFSLKQQRGQLLIELAVAIGIASIFLPALITGLVATREGKAQQQQRLQGLHILKEAEEAVRSVRESGWSVFAQNGTFHPVISGSTWSLAPGSGTIDGYTTTVLIEDVYRDGAGAIVTSGGSLDLSTKKVTTTVSWNTPFFSEVESVTYLTRFLENAAYTETTQAQFNAGVKSGVTVRATSPPAVADDGEVLLGAGGHSDWCTPSLLENEADLAGQGYASSVTAIEGKAFAGTGENASGLAFMDIDISNAFPPTATVGSTFDGHKTNGVFGEENYGYITTDTNAREVVIIDISGATYTESGYFDAPGNGSADGIFVVGGVGYMTVGNKLYSFNLSSKSGARAILDADGVTLAGTGTSVYVLGTYAYVSISGSSTSEMQIVDVSDPNNMQIVGQANVDSLGAADVIVNSTGDRAYLITGNSGSQNELFIIDTTTKSGNRPTVGSYNTSGMDPRGVTVVPGNLVIIVGSGGVEYQVIDISNESSPQKCGEEDTNTTLHDIASVLESDGDAYSYVVTSDADAEFRIVAGGPGGSYAASGVFESATFNPGYQTANNRFTATFSEPAGTDLRFQVSMAVLVGGVCPGSGYTFVGPDGTPGTYFDPASGEPVTFPFGSYGSYTNPGNCLRYKVYFSTNDTGSSPVLNEVIINYSP